MSLISNTGTLTISGTALAAAAASMSSGQWLNFGASSGTTGLINFSNPVSASNTGIRTSYCSQFCYDSVSKKLLAHTSDHAESSMLHIYSESTNRWDIDHTASWMVVTSATAVHGYNHNVFAKGVMYSRKIQEQIIRRWDGYGTTTWASIPITVGPGGNISAAGHCYHEALNRILVHQLGANPNGVLLSINPDNTTQQAVLSSSLLNPGDPHNFACYNRNSQVAWFGGGNGCLHSWTIDASGTIQQAADSPFEAGSSNTEARAVANPNNGNFILIADATHWYDFITATRTFVARAGLPTGIQTNLGSQQGDTNIQLMGAAPMCCAFELGVIVMLKGWARGVASEMWLFKP